MSESKKRCPLCGSHKNPVNTGSRPRKLGPPAYRTLCRKCEQDKQRAVSYTKLDYPQLLKLSKKHVAATRDLVRELKSRETVLDRSIA